MTDNNVPFKKTKAELRKDITRLVSEHDKLFYDSEALGYKELSLMEELVTETEKDAVELLVAKLRVLEAKAHEVGLRSGDVYGKTEELKRQLEEE